MGSGAPVAQLIERWNVTEGHRVRILTAPWVKKHQTKVVCDNPSVLKHLMVYIFFNNSVIIGAVVLKRVFLEIKLNFASFCIIFCAVHGFLGRMVTTKKLTLFRCHEMKKCWLSTFFCQPVSPSRNVDWIVSQHSSNTHQLCRAATPGEARTHYLRITLPRPARGGYNL